MPINKVARASFEELRSRYGITDLTPDEVLELNDLGAAVEAAGKPSDTEERVAAPLRVGGVVLHPLTCAASDFFERFHETNLPEDVRSLLLPFAMAHGRGCRRFLSSLVTADDVVREVRSWKLEVEATPKELDDAAADILCAENAAPDRESSIRDAVLTVCSFVATWDAALADRLRCECTDKLRAFRKAREADSPRGAFFWRKLCVELGALTGVSPDYWYEEGREYALIAWRRVWERESMRAGGGASRDKDELTRALHEQRAAMSRIVEGRKPKETEGA